MKRVFTFLILVVSLPSIGYAQTDAVLPDITLPTGFSIRIYTDEVPNARSMTLGDQQTIFVSTRRGGRVYAVVPQADTKPTIITIAENLRFPNGIAFHEGDLYVAETARIIRFAEIENHLDDIPEYTIVTDSLPTESHHGWRYIAFGPDEKLYVTIGAPCNVCEREGFGEILRMNADGSDVEVVAQGVRNSVGLAWDPDTGDLWFTDNGRDMMGDDLPAGELNHAESTGLHFGFPYCHGGDLADPEFGVERSCSEFTAPAQKLDPHVAPLGLVFYDGGMFPPDYQRQVFIAEHGSWNRSQKIGYRISNIRMIDDRPQSYAVFAEGWLKAGEVSGRPVDLLVLQDGSMLVSDDQAGSLYQIVYSPPAIDNLTTE